MMLNGGVDDGELEALAALASRILGQAAPWGQAGEPIVVRPGSIAPDLGPDFPLPAASRVIGSYATGSYSVTALSAASQPLDIIRFYDRDLRARGWYPYEPATQGGFLPAADRAHLFATYCRSVTGPSLTVDAAARPSRGTGISLRLERDPERVPCGHPPAERRGRGGPIIPPVPLPMLVAPPGATVGARGQGSSPGQYQSHADMESELDLDGIVAHYSQILEEAGWSLAGRGRTGPVAWSIWRCHDESGERVEGFFLALQTGENAYRLSVERDVAPGSRAEAEMETREMGRTLAKQNRRSVVRIEIEEPASQETLTNLHELILREAAYRDPEGNGPAARLLPGALPADLPLVLPIPPATRILGTIITGRWTDIHAVSETQPRDIETLYREAFPSPPWTVIDQSRGLGGFKAGPLIPEFNGLFCPGEASTSFALKAWRRADGPVEVSIHIFTDPTGSPCNHPGHFARGSQRRQPTLPVLSSPPDAVFSSGGGGGGAEYWESRGYLFTDQHLSDIAGWYGSQFAEDGWTEVGHGLDDLLAWSEWRKASERALFLALRHSGTDACTLIACAVRIQE